MDAEGRIGPQLKRGISRQLSGGSTRSGKVTFRRNLSFDQRLGTLRRYNFERLSTLDPERGGSSALRENLAVPENLDSTMQLLFRACRGVTKGVEDLLKEGIDVNSIDTGGRTALHVVACEGNVEILELLLSWRANFDARDLWGSTPTADAKYFGNVEVYTMLKARGATLPKIRRTAMTVSNPNEIPDYELNPGQFQFRRGEEVLKDTYQVAKWNGTKVSVKILDNYLDTDRINAFEYELNLLQKVRHPNAIQFIGAVTQTLPMMINLEYIKVDLASYLQKRVRLQPDKVLRYAIEIARGMNYLHRCKPDPIIHCNLKPKNIFVNTGTLLKVAGFGLIRLSNVSHDKVKLADAKAQLDCLSLYVAPEIYRDQAFDTSVDVFSFGLILYEMAEGAPAFQPKYQPEEVSRMICVNGWRPRMKRSKNYPREIKNLIEECWDQEPSARPTFSEIIFRLDKAYASYVRHRWRETFKIRWTCREGSSALQVCNIFLQEARKPQSRRFWMLGEPIFIFYINRYVYP